ncbi:MAG: WD40 repeat domain-containing protein, partial [Planctomycetota bacterium]
LLAGGATLVALAGAVAVVAPRATPPTPSPQPGPPPAPPVQPPLPPVSPYGSSKSLRLERTFGDRRWTIGQGAAVFAVAARAPRAVAFAHGIQRLAVVDLATGDVALGMRLDGEDTLDIDMTPDGARFAVACGPTVYVFDTAAPRKPLARLEAEHSTPAAIALTADGARVLSGDREGKVRLWEVAKPGAPLHAVATHEGHIARVAFTKGEEGFVASSYGKTLEVRSFAEGGARVSVPLEKTGGIFVVSPDGARLLVQTGAERVELRDTATGTLVADLRGGSGLSELDDVHFSPDGEKALTLSGEKVKLWSLPDGHFLRDVAHGLRFVSHIEFARGGTHVAVAGSTSALRLIDLATGLDAVPAVRGSIRQVVLDASASRATLLDADTIERVDLATGASTLPGGGAPFLLDRREIALAPGGDRALLRSQDKGSKSVLQLWDLASEVKLRDLQGSSNPKKPAFSADGRHGAAMAGGNRLHVWDLESGALRTNVDMTDPERGEGGYAMPGWILFDRDALHALWWCDMRLTRVAVPGGAKVAAARFDTSGGTRGAAITPTGDAVLVATIEPPALLVSLGPPLASREIGGRATGSECVAVAPDGRRALLGGSDGSLVLCDLETGRELERVMLEGDMATSLAFSSDGRTLVVGTARGIVLVYRVS